MTVEVGPVTVETTVTVGVVVVVVVVEGVGSPEYVNWASATAVVVLDTTQDALTEYVPLTHSQYGLPVVKLAPTAPEVAIVTDFEKSTVPYGFVTCNRITVPAGGVGVIVAEISPVWVPV